MKPTLSGKAPCNNIEIYFEAFGEKENPAIVLIMGLDSQSILFSFDFMRPLVEAGYYVIRFDNRDIGLSTWMNDQWHPKRPYTLEDMAKDTISLMDFLSIDKGHIIGVSMGGMIAQRIAISYKPRVLSLTSIMSSGFALDPASVSFFKGRLFYYLVPFFVRNFRLNTRYFTRRVSVAGYVKTFTKLNGKGFPVNREHLLNVFTEAIEIRKGQNPRARFQQFCGIVASGSRLNELPSIRARTLVIHGTADPLIPPIHARIYAPKIPGATMLWVEGMGHQFSKPVIDKIMPVILTHLKPL
ncbi:alpha/beta fold hydrolase [Emticicia fluvialis]|uniref:alpha/beta fold hydrolase n=1 Tax=Emticicia fluvialis TaxID=2974474 RepID=UPI002164F4F3|nr:alpha/beta hydrolase [Emticicia fluvialis]